MNKIEEMKRGIERQIPVDADGSGTHSGLTGEGSYTGYHPYKMKKRKKKKKNFEKCMHQVFLPC
jgi:hypothetical protein